MQKIPPLLPNEQLHRTVIRAQHSIVDNDILDERDKCLRNEEVIESPAHTALTCREPISPPCILNTIRVKMAIGIHEAMVENLLHHGAFLWKKTGCFYILFRVFQVNGHMRSIEIPGDNDLLTHGMQFVTHFQKVCVEIQFIVHALFAALATWEVNIEQTKIRMKCGDEAALHVKERRIHAKLSLKRGRTQKCGHSAISGFDGGIPDGFVSGEVTLLFCQLVGAGLDLLQTKHIGLLLEGPGQRIPSKGSTDTIYIPCDYLHCSHFMVNFKQITPMATNLKSILCIEDEPEMIDLMRLILGRRGFAVKGAAGGIEGLRIIRAERPDLVLLDLMMPDMDGWEVYQQMKADENTKNIPVIVVTAKAQSIDKVLGLHIAKVDDYLAKPFSPQDLLSSVERVLKSKS